MKTYLVGGAVRDKLLGLPIKDNDWVVTGSTPEQMKQQGFLPVGKDFPVFLHPQSKEEYALARTERKSGHGYAGFVFHTSPDVSIEEDLLRRDLTINAIAEDENGRLIDPYNGQQDIQKKRLRHVSSAFQEDPLRILRIARFAARFHNHGFSVANETLQLMKSMVRSHEVTHLVAERVWQETVRALMEPTPEVYFQVLHDCGALSVVLPEIDELVDHDASTPSSLFPLQWAARQQAKDTVRFGSLFADANNDQAVKALAKRLHLPTAFTEIATLVVHYAATLPMVLTSSDADAWMRLYEQTDALRRPERFADWLSCCQCIHQADLSDTLVAKIHHYLEHLMTMNARELVKQGVKGKDIGQQLRSNRVTELAKLIG